MQKYGTKGEKIKQNPSEIKTHLSVLSCRLLGKRLHRLAMAILLQLNTGAVESHHALIPLISLENERLSSVQVDVVQPFFFSLFFFKVIRKNSNSPGVQC